MFSKCYWSALKLQYSNWKYCSVLSLLSQIILTKLGILSYSLAFWLLHEIIFLQISCLTLFLNLETRLPVTPSILSLIICLIVNHCVKIYFFRTNLNSWAYISIIITKWAKPTPQITLRYHPSSNTESVNCLYKKKLVVLRWEYSASKFFLS